MPLTAHQHPRRGEAWLSPATHSNYRHHHWQCGTAPRQTRISASASGSDIPASLPLALGPLPWHNYLVAQSGWRLCRRIARVRPHLPAAQPRLRGSLLTCTHYRPRQGLVQTGVDGFPAIFVDVRVLDDWATKRRTRLRVDGELSPEYSMLAGTPQGDLLPCCLIFYIEPLIRYIKSLERFADFRSQAATVL